MQKSTFLRCQLRLSLIALMALLIAPTLLADPGIIDVTAAQYGATPNFSSDDDTLPIQNAINAAAQTGAVVYFPKGQYDLNGTLRPNLANGRVYLRGAGMEISILRWRNNVHGIEADYGSGLYYERSPLTVSDLTLASSNGSASAALRLKHVTAASVAAQTLRVFNVEIRPEPQLVDSNGWGTGIYMENAWNAHLNDVVIHFPRTNGIEITGQSNDAVISRVKIFGRDGTRGIFITGDTEGTMIDHSTIMGFLHGIEINQTCKPPDAPVLPGCRPHAIIDHNHVVAQEIAIAVWGHPQVGLTSNLIYQGRTIAGALSPFVGIYLSNSNEIRLSGNNLNFTGSPSGGSYGIVASTNNSTFMGTVIDLGTNQSGYYTIGMWFPPSSTSNTVVGNTAYLPAGISHIVDTGVGNVKSANTP